MDAEGARLAAMYGSARGRGVTPGSARLASLEDLDDDEEDENGEEGLEDLEDIAEPSPVDHQILDTSAHLA